MSNVYILPRSFATTTELPVTFQQGQRPIRMIRTGAVNGRILNDRRSIRLQGMVPKNTDTSRRVYLAPMIATPAKNHSRTHYQLQPVAPAPTNADFISLQPIQKNLDSENSRSSSFISQQPQMFISDNISQNQQQLSEEDNELDIGEVYRLLDESAGQRISDLEQPRRRERLSNLTLEQKLLRRKQKNRIAAQAARDRKKETNKRLEESLKRAIQEISRLRGELRLLQAQNAQLSASQNLQNNEEKIIQNIPKENIIQRKTFIFPKQEILMATIDDQQQNYQYNVNTSANTQNFQQEQTQMMNQNQTKSVDLKSNFLSSSIASHQSNGNNSLRQSSPSIKPNNSSPFQHDSLGSAVGTGICARGESYGNKGSYGQNAVKLNEEQQRQNNTNVQWSSTAECSSDGLHDQGAHGTLVDCMREEGDIEDVHELQNIFDELFEEMDVPVDVDRFCNEVIEEGIAAENVVDGQRQASTSVQQSSTTSSGTFVNAYARDVKVEESSETREYSEEFDFGTNEQQHIHEQQRFSFERGGTEQHRVSRRGGLSHSSSAALAALSPHNYCSQTTIIKTPLFNQQTQKNYQKYHKHSTVIQSQLQYQQHQSISSSDYISDNGLLGTLHEVPSPFKEEQYRQPHSLSSPFYNCSSGIIATNPYSTYGKYEGINEECYEENVESPMLPFCQNDDLRNGDFEDYYQDPNSSFDYGLEQQQLRVMDTAVDEQTLINDGDEVFYQNHPDSSSFSPTNFPFLVDGLGDDPSSSLQA